jgi:hypothetical protein
MVPISDPVGSWSRFIELKEAAKERNASLGASGAKGGAGAKFSGILSAKLGADVYSSMAVKPPNGPAERADAKGPATVGRMFDSYA